MTPLTKPLVIDLCHGYGGWTDGFLAEGYRVIGVDVTQNEEYRGEHVQGDVRVLLTDLRQRRYLKGWYGRILEEMTNAAVIVASPPCEEFSRHQMPWTRAREST
jgi:site-specific DNA-cytosine methylase